MINIPYTRCWEFYINYAVPIRYLFAQANKYVNCNRVVKARQSQFVKLLDEITEADLNRSSKTHTGSELIYSSYIHRS